MSNGGHRLWPYIATAVAVAVIAVPAASAGVPPIAGGGGHKYSTNVTLVRDHCCLYHGVVESELRKCQPGRRVTLFRQRPGSDRRLGTTVSAYSGLDAVWRVHARPHIGVYAKVERKVRKSGDVCLGDRSETLTYRDIG